MKPATFDRYRTFIHSVAGITLGQNKESLVSARIGKRMRQLSIIDPDDYLDHIHADKSGMELVHLINAVSTNVTSFFREPQHFEFLTKQMQQWVQTGQKRFRIWCGAASTGEEPYTIAMTLAELGILQKLDVKILATDISTEALAQCENARYTKEKLRGIPPQLIKKYLETRDGQTYVMNDLLRRSLMFRRLNLNTPPFPMQGPLDIVFIRNVMIYFDNTVRQRLLAEVNRLLKPGGILLVGHAESLTGILTDLKVLQPSVYVKK